jgi:hypothetical protein
MEFKQTARTGAGLLFSAPITALTPKEERAKEQPLITLLETKKDLRYTKPIAHTLYIKWRGGSSTPTIFEHSP